MQETCADVVEQRYQAVLAVIRDGVLIAEVARRFDVSRQAVHLWLRWYEAQGLAGLVDRSHQPPRCSHQMDRAVEVWIFEARRRNLREMNHPGLLGGSWRCSDLAHPRSECWASEPKRVRACKERCANR